MAKPEISRITPFQGGETVQIFCENADIKSEVYWWRPIAGENKNGEGIGLPGSYTLPETPPADSKVFNVYDVADNVIYVTYGNVPGGTACFWVKNEDGFSAPFIANSPEIWNQSLDELCPGAVLTVYGDRFWGDSSRRFALKNIKTGEIKILSSVSIKSRTYSFDSYRHQAFLKLPDDTAAGEYEVFIHNGTGSELGWSNGIKITVKKEYSLTEYYRTSWNRDVSDSMPMPKAYIKAVEPNIMGAHFDITDEVQAAVDEVYANGGGIVMLGAGTYGFSHTVTLKPGVILQGAGSGATIVRSVYGKDFTCDWSDVFYAYRKSGGKHWAVDWKPHWDKLDNCAFVRIYDDAGVDSIKFELGGGVNMGVLVAGNTEDAYVYGAFLNDVEVDGEGMNTYLDGRFGKISAGLVCVSNTRELTAFRCNFVAICPIYVLPAYNIRAKMIGNNFRCSPKQKDESYMCGFRYSMFIENNFLDGRRSFMAQEGFSNNWVYQNRSSGVSKGSNANEVYMSEYGDSDWSGFAYEVGSDYIKADVRSTSGQKAHDYDQSRGCMDSEDLKEYPRFLVVIRGRGFGQFREIASVDGDRVNLNEPWSVVPDKDTAFTIVYATFRNLWVDNVSSMSNSHSQFIWNCGIENIISGHEINMSAGIRLYSNCYYARSNTTCVVAFNRIEHCQVRGGGKGLWLSSDGWRISGKPDYVKYTAGGCFGNSVRQCAFDGSSHMQYVKNLPHYKNGAYDIGRSVGVKVGGGFNTFCNNLIGGYKTAVELCDECKGNCFENNSYFGYDLVMQGHGIPTGCDIKREKIKL